MSRVMPMIAFLVALFLACNPVFAGSVRGKRPNLTRRDATSSNERHFLQEINIKNLSSDRACLEKLESGEVGDAVRMVIEEMGSQMGHIMAPVQNISSIECSDFRPLESGWTWHGRGKLTYSNTPMDTSLLSLARSQQFAVDSGNRDLSGDDTDATYETIMWKFHTLLEKKLTSYLAFTFGEECYRFRPQIELIVTSLTNPPKHEEGC